MSYNLDAFRQILGQDQYHLTQPSTRIQIENFQQLTSLFTSDLLENLPAAGRQVVDRRITDAVHRAEDEIELHIINHVLFENLANPLDLTDVLEEFYSIRQEISALMLLGDPPPAGEEHDGHDLISNYTVVGFGDDLSQLLDRLIYSPSKERQAIPIVGMGGMGKTTLARLIYNDASIDDHFDVRAWVTLSHQFDARRSLRVLLHCLKPLFIEMHREDEYKLGVHVHKNLHNRRYFIVIDNIWNTEAWDRLSVFFPEDNNGSRILLTTRDRNVANSVSGRGHEMSFLDEDNSWDLLRQNVFVQGNCPPELISTGRNIAINCEGHPLAIIATAGVLKKSDNMPQFWELVNENLSSTVTRLDEGCLNGLSVSYELLPYYLKPCFLYLGAFHEDNQIRASKIIKLWVAEGLIKPDGDNTLEHVAELNLNSLIDRNLLTVCQRDSNDKIRTFRIHHLFRELCQRKAVEENFLWFRNSHIYEIPEGERVVRRLSVCPTHEPSIEMQQMLLARSFLCFGFAPQHFSSLFFESKLLRVLDVFQIECVQFPIEIETLMNLRYLGLCCRSLETSSIVRFRNIQTLILRLPLHREICLPSLLWEMTNLMHIEFKGTCIRYIPENGQNAIQNDIETLSYVEAFRISELIQRSPNLRKLGVYYNTPIDTEIDLAGLSNLEQLKCSSTCPSSHEFLSYLRLPISLNKLNLSFCIIPCNFMTTVGELPNLEQLKMKNCDFLGVEGDPTEMEIGSEESRWEPVEEGFLKLISLTMKNLELVYWTAESCHFPVLQHLVIQGCYLLEGIPSDIGWIDTLRLIEVDEASRAVVDSAMKIKAEQDDLGNLLEVVVHPPV